MAVVELDRVGKIFPNGHTAIHELDLRAEDGELLVLVGPSGSGKSTALRIIAGLESPSSGRVIIDGEDVTDVPPQQRDLAMVFQSYALYPHKSVRENLAFPLRVRRLPRSVVNERVVAAARLLGIDGLLERRPAQLSGGERQRVALGRALVREPRAFLFDEPLSNLDPTLRVQTRTELASLHRRLAATMVYVTHDQEEALTLGDRIAVLRDGRLQQVAGAMAVYQRPANVFVAGFIGSPAMNFFPCSMREDPARIVSEHFSLRLETALLGLEPLTLGIRPHEIEIAVDGDGDVSGAVETVEPRGSECLLRVRVGHSSAGGVNIAVVVPWARAVPAGTPISLRIPPSRLHLFDSGGVRIPDP